MHTTLTLRLTGKECDLLLEALRMYRDFGRCLRGGRDEFQTFVNDVLTLVAEEIARETIDDYTDDDVERIIEG